MKARFAGDSESDHIGLLRAFEGWERAKRAGDARQYCWDNFLSHNTLEVKPLVKAQDDIFFTIIVWHIFLSIRC